jgi:transposase
MRDTDVFSILLGLNDFWEVSSVDLQVDESKLVVHVDHVGILTCPVCGRDCPLYDHSAERSWRHLDTMQFATYVVARVPRSNCAEHGVKQTCVPWAGVKSRFTELFEKWAIQVLLLTKSQSRTAKLLRLSGDQVHDIMHRAVDRGLARRELGEIVHVSVDEKSFQKGHDYATVVCDVKGKRVVEVTRGRNEKAAKKAFGTLPKPESVKTVTLDMSEAFKNGAADSLPGADLIHDRFHVAMMLSRAVDSVRRAEVKARPELRGSRYVWLKNPENLTDKQKLRFDELVGIELKTGEAYALKQVFRGFFEHDSEEEALQFFEDWTKEVAERKLSPLKKVAATLTKNLRGLLNYIKWKLNNGYAEAVNGLIQEIKTAARGFRKFENFRIAILFFHGKLDLNPRKCL